MGEQAAAERVGISPQVTSYLDKDEPGVLFGLVETPWGSRELLYAVLFRHENSDFWKVSNDYHSGLQFDGRLASIKDHLAIDGKGIDLELEVSVDRTEIKSKKVVIDGVVVDADKGNLLLLDLTTDEPRWKQIDADPLTDLLDPKDVLEKHGACHHADRANHETFLG